MIRAPSLAREGRRLSPVYVSFVSRQAKAMRKKAPHDLHDRLIELLELIKKAKWSNPNDVKHDLPTAEIVRRNLVMNCGSKYRITASIDYAAGEVMINRVMHHDEYDNGRWKLDR